MPRLASAPVRPLEPNELSLANRWAIEEGWNPGPRDAAIFNVIDPGSLLAVDVEGAPVGVISATRMTPDFGFVGFFVLSPEFRRARYAWTLLQASLERMEGRVAGSETIFQLVRTYARYGMRPHYHTVSYHGVAPSFPATWHRDVEPASTVPLKELAAYDAMSVGVDRSSCLREWLSLPGSRALVVKRRGQVCGLGAARLCHRGVRIGPLQADDGESAEALFDALAGLAPGEELSIDCPDINPASAKLALAKGLSAGSATARLYRGPPPAGMLHRVYGLMSFALG